MLNWRIRIRFSCLTLVGNSSFKKGMEIKAKIQSPFRDTKDIVKRFTRYQYYC